MHKTRICIACKRGHNRSDRLCWECRNSAALRTLRGHIAELEQRNRELEHELAVLQAESRPSTSQLQWYEERDRLARGITTPLDRASVYQMSLEAYLEWVYGPTKEATCED